ncbi:MAG: histidine kinase [Flammeovirgaceae bacterium]
METSLDNEYPTQNLRWQTSLRNSLRNMSAVKITLLSILLLFIGAIAYLLYSLGLDTVYYVAIIWIFSVLIVLWIGNSLIVKLLDKTFPWEVYTAFRFFVQIVTSIIFSLLCLNLTYYFFKVWFTDYPPTLNQILVMNIYGLLFLVPVSSIHLGLYFMAKWKQAFIQTESLKQENIRSQLESLKNHLDPHFLFNNLNILSSLIDKENKDAVMFLDNFSEVYRYILQMRKTELVKVETELEVVKAYQYMLDKRFREGILLEIKVDEKVLKKKFIPPLCLQMLVENIVKHNVISSQTPLYAEISNDCDDYLVIRNDIKQKNYGVTSSQTGLENIRRRYSYLTDKKMEVIEKPDSFIVKIPLLNLGML